MMRIAMFGGTFDPIHRGHVAIAEFVIRTGLTDKLLFIPAPDPPHKQGVSITPYAVRRKMLQIGAEHLLSHGDTYEISDMECERTGKSYSLLTLQALRTRYPGASIAMIIGGDSLASLHTWFRAHDIVADFDILSYPRPGSCVTKDMLQEHWSEAECQKLLSGVMSDAPVLDISSTEIRNAFKSGCEIPECWLLEAERLWILQNKIYSK